MKKLLWAGLILSLLIGGTAAFAAGKELKALVVDFKIKLQGKDVANKSKIVIINGEYYISVKDAATLLGNGAKVTVDKPGKTIQFNAPKPSLDATPSGNSNGNQSGTAADNFKINIPDAELLKVIRRQIYTSAGDIYYNDIKSITKLEGQIRGVKSLEGLQHFKQLKTLNLTGGEPEDLTPLAQLTQLETLDLYKNKITDIKPLAGLKNLKTLNLSFNAIKDLTPLQGLTKLQTLYLQSNQITDISPLKNLTDLTVLGFSGNRITDITALKGKKLQSDRFSVVAAEGKLFVPLHAYSPAFEIDNKIYLLKWAKMAGGSMYFYADADNRLYSEGKSSFAISDFMNLSESVYSISPTDNPYVGGAIEIGGPNYVPYVKEETVYTSATASYPIFRIYNKQNALIHTAKLEKGNYQGAIDLNDSIGSFLVPFEDLLAQTGVTFDFRFDKEDMLIIFKLKH